MSRLPDAGGCKWYSTKFDRPGDIVGYAVYISDGNPILVASTDRELVKKLHDFAAAELKKICEQPSQDDGYSYDEFAHHSFDVIQSVISKALASHVAIDEFANVKK